METTQNTAKENLKVLGYNIELYLRDEAKLKVLTDGGYSGCHEVYKATAKLHELQGRRMTAITATLKGKLFNYEDADGVSKTAYIECVTGRLLVLVDAFYILEPIDLTQPHPEGVVV